MNWQSIGVLLLFLIATGAINLAALRLLFRQHELANGERLDALRRRGTDHSQQLERELINLKSQLPAGYVRREDWIRFGALIDAKLDSIRHDMAVVRDKFDGQA